MQKSNLYRAEQLTEPHSVGVICLKKSDGKLNLIPVTSWNFMDGNSPFLYFALSKNSYTGYCLLKNRDFTFSVPDISIAKQVNLWGHSSGNYEDKLKKAPVEIDEVSAGLFAPAESCVVMLCKYKQFVTCGEHFLFICEINDVYCNDKRKPLFSYNSRTVLDVAEKPKSTKFSLKIEKMKNN